MQTLRRAWRRIRQLWLFRRGLSQKAEDQRIIKRAERRQDGKAVLDGSGHDRHLY